MSARQWFTQSWVMAQNPAKEGQSAAQEANLCRAASRQAVRSLIRPDAQLSQPCTSAAFLTSAHACWQPCLAALASGTDAASATASATASASTCTAAHG